MAGGATQKENLINQIVGYKLDKSSVKHAEKEKTIF